MGLGLSGSAGLRIPLAGAESKSAAHRIALALVWATVAASSIVLFEPAPVEATTFGLFILLPAIGLTASNKALAGGFVIWLVIAACSLFSAAISRDVAGATTHSIVSLYLAGACFLFASFVAKNPLAHTRLILNAYLCASVFAAALGIIGYLDLVPGAFDALTRYSRATSTFKDPNVFGPFLICGLLTALHLWLTRPAAAGAAAIAAAVVIAVGILFTFSRGAWAATALASALYVYLYMITADRNMQRLKLAGAILLSAAALGIVLAAALQSDGVGRLLEERASIAQPYDQGAEGRFGGQRKALDLAIESPLGLGAGVFSGFHHHEEPHNAYLSMTLNAGWLGGLLYFIVCAGTLALGFQQALRRTRTQSLFLIVYAALAANIAEGVLIDTDHWRHFYLLMGVVWGLMAADRRITRCDRVIRDVRPILLRPLLVLPPSRREPRVIARSAPSLPTALPRYGLAPPRRRVRRAHRIAGASNLATRPH